MLELITAWGSFGILNFLILLSDIKERKIPNIFLGGLLVIFGIYFFEISHFTWISCLGIVIYFLLGFCMYHFGIWAAGDAKYFIVLALFIPFEFIPFFIGYIGFIVLFWIFISALWFYLRNFHPSSGLLRSIKKDFFDSFSHLQK